MWLRWKSSIGPSCRRITDACLIRTSSTICSLTLRAWEGKSDTSQFDFAASSRDVGAKWCWRLENLRSKYAGLALQRAQGDRYRERRAVGAPLDLPIGLEWRL